MRCTAVSRILALCPPVGMATALKTPESWMAWTAAKIRYRLLDGYFVQALGNLSQIWRVTSASLTAEAIRKSGSCQAGAFTAGTPDSSVPLATHGVLNPTTWYFVRKPTRRSNTPLYLSTWRSTNSSHRILKLSTHYTTNISISVTAVERSLFFSGYRIRIDRRWVPENVSAA
ncbi:hypothetical protein LX36DRAFT_26394 [Colletotrichum falcatum]|nr:hypothetical protein LX36DRAFT_26394 [Colletotrichum falcatum]